MAVKRDESTGRGQEVSLATYIDTIFSSMSEPNLKNNSFGNFPNSLIEK
jgi:hypothetical protein